MAKPVYPFLFRKLVSDPRNKEKFDKRAEASLFNSTFFYEQENVSKETFEVLKKDPERCFIAGDAVLLNPNALPENYMVRSERTESFVIGHSITIARSTFWSSSDIYCSLLFDSYLISKIIGMELELVPQLVALTNFQLGKLSELQKCFLSDFMALTSFGIIAESSIFIKIENDLWIIIYCSEPIWGSFVRTFDIKNFGLTIKFKLASNVKRLDVLISILNSLESKEVKLSLSLPKVFIRTGELLKEASELVNDINNRDEISIVNKFRKGVGTWFFSKNQGFDLENLLNPKATYYFNDQEVQIQAKLKLEDKNLDQEEDEITFPLLYSGNPLYMSQEEIRNELRMKIDEEVSIARYLNLMFATNLVDKHGEPISSSYHYDKIPYDDSHDHDQYS